MTATRARRGRVPGRVAPAGRTPPGRSGARRHAGRATPAGRAGTGRRPAPGRRPVAGGGRPRRLPWRPAPPGVPAATTSRTVVRMRGAAVPRNRRPAMPGGSGGHVGRAAPARGAPGLVRPVAGSVTFRGGRPREAAGALPRTAQGHATAWLRDRHRRGRQRGRGLRRRPSRAWSRGPARRAPGRGDPRSDLLEYRLRHGHRLCGPFTSVGSGAAGARSGAARIGAGADGARRRLGAPRRRRLPAAAGPVPDSGSPPPDERAAELIGST